MIAGITGGATRAYGASPIDMSSRTSKASLGEPEWVRDLLSYFPQKFEELWHRTFHHGDAEKNTRQARRA